MSDANITSNVSHADTPGNEVPVQKQRRPVKIVLQYVGCIVVAVVWLQSSSAHLANSFYFLSSVYQYELVGSAVGKLTAMVLPILQLLLAVCLVGRLFVDGALLLSTALLTLFLAVQVSAFARDINVSCGCFGATLSEPIGATSILNAGILLVVSIACYATRS